MTDVEIRHRWDDVGNSDVMFHVHLRTPRDFAKARHLLDLAQEIAETGAPAKDVATADPLMPGTEPPSV